LKRLDVLQFQNDVKESELYLNPATTTNGFTDQLDTVTTGILNKHCPQQTCQKIAPTRQVNRWLSNHTIEAKWVRRHLELKWKSKGNRNDCCTPPSVPCCKEITKASGIAEATDDPR